MAKNEKRIQVTLACESCKRRNYITTKNKMNDRERIEMKKFCCGTAATPSTRRPADPPTGRRPTPAGAGNPHGTAGRPRW